MKALYPQVMWLPSSSAAVLSFFAYDQTRWQCSTPFLCVATLMQRKAAGMLLSVEAEVPLIQMCP